MAQKTYLQLVNEVLKRLREDQVTTVSQNDYSTLIGTFVDDAKHVVENAWNWNILLQSLSFSSTIGVNNYDVSIGSAYAITGTLTTEFSKLAYDSCDMPLAFDMSTAQRYQLIERDWSEIISENILNNPVQNQDQPIHFAIQQQGDGLNITFLDLPSSVRPYTFYFYTPQDELTADSDVMRIYWRPVVTLATLYALDERGEEIGEGGAVANAKFTTSLSDAIAIDNLVNNYRADFSV